MGTGFALKNFVKIKAAMSFSPTLSDAMFLTKSICSPEECCAIPDTRLAESLGVGLMRGSCILEAFQVILIRVFG